MNHAITVGTMLTLLVIVVGLCIAGFGFIEWLASGMSDNQSAGDKAGKQGCFLFALGAGIIIAAALRGAGAAAPPTRIETVEVKVPVAVQPITPAQVPAVPAPLGPRPPTLQQSADALLAKVCEFVGYAIKADPLLRISAGGKPVELQLYPECERK